MLETMQAVNEILAREKMDARYESTRVRISTHATKKPEQLLEFLHKARTLHGWVCFQSAVVSFPLSELPGDVGLPLSGELADGNKSMHFLPDGAGGWTLTDIIETDDGDDMLTDEVVYLGGDRAPGALRYRRFWRRTADGGYAPHAVRFIGFEEVE